MTWLGRFKKLAYLLVQGVKRSGGSRSTAAFVLAEFAECTDSQARAWILNWHLWDDDGPKLIPLDYLPARLSEKGGSGIDAYGLPLEWFQADRPGPC